MTAAPCPDPAVSGISPNPCSSTASVFLTASTVSLQFTGVLTRSKAPALAGLLNYNCTEFGVIVVISKNILSQKAASNSDAIRLYAQ